MDPTVAGAIIGAALMFVGQLIYWWATGAPAAEAISKTNTLLDVREKMTAQGATIDDLDKLEAALTKKTLVRRKIEDRITAELAEQEPHDETEYMPQQTMNRWQETRAKEMDTRLQGKLIELQGYLTDSERDQLQKVQSAWSRYRNAQAAYASLLWEGGTMQPFAHWSEHTQLSIERIASLEEEIAQRRTFRREFEED